eukprot:g6256.t1
MELMDRPRVNPQSTTRATASVVPVHKEVVRSRSLIASAQERSQVSKALDAASYAAQVINREHRIASRRKHHEKKAQDASNVTIAGLAMMAFGLLMYAASRFAALGLGATMLGAIVASTSDSDIDDLCRKQPLVPMALMMVFAMATWLIGVFYYPATCVFVYGAVGQGLVLYRRRRRQPVPRSRTTHVLLLAVAAWASGIAVHRLVFAAWPSYIRRYGYRDDTIWEQAQNATNPDHDRLKQNLLTRRISEGMRALLSACVPLVVALLYRRTAQARAHTRDWSKAVWQSVYAFLGFFGLSLFSAGLFRDRQYQDPSGGQDTMNVIIGASAAAVASLVTLFRAVLFAALSMAFTCARALVPGFNLFWAREKLGWTTNHELTYSWYLRSVMLPLVDKFGPQLHLCRRLIRHGNIKYYHYFITDGSWTIEFGQGDISDTFVVVRHTCDMVGDTAGAPAPLLEGAPDVELTFANSDAVHARMREMCGANNYALCLRNCEHVARYIHCGRWVSLQMLDNGQMRNNFIHQRMGVVAKLVNTCPLDIVRRVQQPVEPLWHSAMSVVQVAGCDVQLLRRTKDQHKNFNIVVVGPAGSGKSTLINRLCNLSVCNVHHGRPPVSNATPTKAAKTGGRGANGDNFELARMQLITGRTSLHGVYNDQVNIMDTIGVSDTPLPAAMVTELVRQQVKSNMAEVHRVVVVCSAAEGPLTEAMAQALVRMMQMFDFKHCARRFTFVCNKCDTLPEASRAACVEQMVSALHTGSLSLDGTGVGGVDLNIAAGFAPGRSYGEDSPELDMLCASIFVPLNEAECPLISTRHHQVVQHTALHSTAKITAE